MALKTAKERLLESKNRQEETTKILNTLEPGDIIYYENKHGEIIEVMVSKINLPEITIDTGRIEYVTDINKKSFKLNHFLTLERANERLKNKLEEQIYSHKCMIDYYTVSLAVDQEHLIKGEYGYIQNFPG